MSNCSGCYQNDCCAITNMFLKYLTSHDICPCITCLVKVVCNDHRCEDYEKLWDRLWRRYIQNGGR